MKTVLLQYVFRKVDNVARRIEHRVSGADANPYLVLAAVLGAALHGIETKMSPPQPIEGDAYAMSERFETFTKSLGISH